MSPGARGEQLLGMMLLSRTLVVAAIGSIALVRPTRADEAAAGRATERLFVLQHHAELLSVYDPATGRRTGGAARIAPIPHQMIATADGRELFVTGYGVESFRDVDAGGNTVTIVDVRRISAVGFVNLGAYHRPHGLARGRSGRIYVTTDAPAALLEIDAAKRSVVREYRLEQALPHMVAVIPDETEAVIANAGAGTVTILPLRAATTPVGRAIAVGGAPMDVLLSADGRLAFVPTGDDNRIAVIDVRARRVARTLACVGGPTRLAWLPDGQHLAVTLLAAGAVAIIDRDTGVESRRIPVGRAPEGLLVDGARDRLFVAVAGENRVATLAMRDWTVAGAIVTAAHPDALWLAPDAPAAPPAGSATGTGNTESDGHTLPLLTPARVVERFGAEGGAQATERAAWEEYLATSARLRTADQALLEEELRTLGRARMSPAPFAHAFKLDAKMTPAWFRQPEGRRMASTVLSFQTPSGGWSKHLDVTGPARLPGESFYSENDRWNYIATIDNDTTTEHLRFLAAAFAATGDAHARAGFERGIGYLLQAQFPNGGWPQVYPLQGGYHDAITYNDNAMINVLQVLGDVAEGRFSFIAPALRQRAAAAVTLGQRCLLATQVVHDGTRRVWGQQHDPLTLALIPARHYELAALAARESAGIVKYLMAVPRPSPEMVVAIQAAVAWFRAHAIFGYDYDGQQGLRAAAPGAPPMPLWARLYEPESQRPLFSDRDGVAKYDWNLLTDRRFGYAWYSQEPGKVVARYDTRWAAEHARAAAATTAVSRTKPETPSATGRARQ